MIFNISESSEYFCFEGLIDSGCCLPHLVENKKEVWLTILLRLWLVTSLTYVCLIQAFSLNWTNMEKYKTELDLILVHYDVE